MKEGGFGGGDGQKNTAKGAGLLPMSLAFVGWKKKKEKRRREEKGGVYI